MIKKILESYKKIFSKNKKSDTDNDEGIILLPLSDLIEKIKSEIDPKIGDKKIKKEIKAIYSEKIHDFNCNKNESLEKFINLKDENNNAVSWELKKRSRTYLLIDENYSNKYGKLVIIGFFTIGLNVIDVDMTKSYENYKKKDIEDLFKETKITYLIGKIAKNDKYKDKITGKDIISFAEEIIHETHMKIGRDLIMIEAYYEKIIAIYSKLGFKIFQRITESSGEVRTQLIKKI